MKITKATESTHRRSIPLKGWGSLESALTTFSHGFTRGSKATEQVTLDAINKEGGSNGRLAVGLFLLTGATCGQPDRLVNEIIATAKEELRNNATFSKSYDYNGMGTAFFKTGVEIRVLDRKQKMYLLEIWAAYVGDEPEAGLAEHLGIPRTIQSCCVEIETEPLPGNRFEFDFDVILKKLQGIIPKQRRNLSGEKIAEAMMTVDQSGESKANFDLFEQNGFKVCIRPGQVSRRFEFNRESQKQRDTWRTEGSSFLGELGRDYSSEDPNAKAPPTLLIGITSSDKLDLGYRKEPKPIWLPSEQQKAITLCTKILRAMKP